MSPGYGWGLEPTQMTSEWERSACNSGPFMTTSSGCWSWTVPPSSWLQWHPIQIPVQVMVVFQGSTLLCFQCQAQPRKHHIWVSAHRLALLEQLDWEVTVKSPLFTGPFPSLGCIGGLPHQWSSGGTRSTHQRCSHNLESEKERDWGGDSFHPPWHTILNTPNFIESGSNPKNFLWLT